MSNGDPPEETKYRFLPSVRRGVRPDYAYTPTGTPPTHGTVSVELDVEGSLPDGTSETVKTETKVRLYGPGDVIGLDSRQVVRTEPADGTTDYPPNYFPHVEFDRPDLPWLFSPERARSADGTARPWLALVVVEKQEAVSLSFDTAGPLPVLTLGGDVTAEEELPPPGEIWAWAHAQVVGSDETVDRGAVAKAFSTDEKRTLSRLIAPRNLRANTAYYACVVPTFEAGRLAGLNEEPSEEGRSLADVSWTPVDGEEPLRLPVYYHWEFATGPRGDFEALVRKLVPRELGMDVGSRPVDLSDPGAEPVAAPWLAGEGDHPALRLGGALRSATFDPKNPSYPDPDNPEAPDSPGTRDALRTLLNRPELLAGETDDTDDDDTNGGDDDGSASPIVGPPTYGQWHADVERLPETTAGPAGRFFDSWLDELNLDPRNRVTAGFGTNVVQDNQESLMVAAWEQFGDLDWANRLIRSAQVARAVGEVIETSLEPVPLTDLLAFTSPMHSQLRWDQAADQTVSGWLETTALPDTVVRPAFRRVTRSRGPLARRVGGSIDVGSIIDGLGDGTRPGGDWWGTPGRTVSVGERFVELGHGDVLGEGETIFEREELSRADDLVGDGGFGEAALPGDDGSPLATEVLGRLNSLEEHCWTARRRLTSLETALWGIESVDESGSVQEIINRIVFETPTIVDRSAAIAGSTFQPLARSLARWFATASDRTSGLDVGQKDEFLSQLGGLHVDLMGAVRGLPESINAGEREVAVDDVRLAIDVLDGITWVVDELRSGIVVGTTTMAFTSGEGPSPDDEPLSLPAEVPSEVLNVESSLIEMVSGRIGLEETWLRESREDPLEEVMAAPEIRRPMYEPLRDLSPEYLCPGVGNIPKDTVGILETNQPFVEAYMVGLSHEMARELLWRRYPTDRRGTYFRHFWDRRAVPSPAGDGPARDIEPIHWWGDEPLGANTPKVDGEADGEDGQLVLIVRGKLLERYPNTRIYAVKAIREYNEDTDADDRVPLFEQRRQELIGDPGGYTDAQLEQWKPMDPSFRGTLAEDVTFFGFDLTVDEAYGLLESDEEEDGVEAAPGWFFVLEEPPGEPRFGLDVATDEDYDAVPYGIFHGSGDDRTMERMGANTMEEGTEAGWNALSWGHLVASEEEQKSYVEVTKDRPWDGEDSWTVESDKTWTDDTVDIPRTWTTTDAATWGANSAHMARITWQLPVRVAIHADDMLPPGAIDGPAGGDEE